MKLPFHLPGPKTTALLGCVALFVIAVVLFDWNWLRPALERHLSENSNRKVTIEDLDVKLRFSLETTVRVRGVYIENAPWAAKRPMAVAGEASFTFPLSSLWVERPIISRLVLVDADVDLERQADGLRNWRLREPEYRGPGRVKILALEAHRSKIHFVHRGIDLDIALAANPLDTSGAGAPRADSGVSNKIDFQGSYRKGAFSGTAMTSAELTIQETGRLFPLVGYISSGKNRLDVDGRVADFFRSSTIDAQLRAVGPSLSTLRVFVDMALPATKPYEGGAQLNAKGNEFRFSGVRAKFGRSDVAGEITYDRNDRSGDTLRPFLRAALRSKMADLSDLGLSAPAGDAAQTRTGNASTSGRVFPPNRFPVERWKTMDGHVAVEATKLVAPRIPAVESLRFTAELKDGVLEVDPIDLGIAGGRAAGKITYDVRPQQPVSRIAIAMTNMRLEKLISRLPAAALNAGPVAARISLVGHGNSVATIAANASGTLSLTMEGGNISNLLDAKLGLNGGKILGLLIRGDRAIPVRCGAIAFDLKNGAGKSRMILLDTEQTLTDGTGTIDLREEKLDLLLTPRPRNPGLFTLRSSIRVHGSLKRLDYSLDKGGARPTAEETAALAKESPCPSALKSARTR